MRIARNPFVLLVLLAPALCMAAEPTAEQVVADIETKMKNIKTFTADMETGMTMGSILMNMSGTAKGKESMLHTTASLDMMQQKMDMVLILDKANIMWMEMDMMGMKQVMKMDMTKMAAMQDEMMGMLPGLGGLGGGMGGAGQNDPRNLLEQMKQSMNITYGGKEQLNGEEVHVLNGTIKEEFRTQLGSAIGDDPDMAAMGLDLASMMTGMKMKFGVNDGFPRSMEMLDKDGVAWMTQSYKNVAIDTPLDDALFTYTPAADAVVMDLTEMMDTGESADPADAEPADTDQP